MRVSCHVVEKLLIVSRMSKVTIEIKCNLKGTETEMHIVILTDGRMDGCMGFHKIPPALLFVSLYTVGMGTDWK